jgi:hypothetical protein
VYVERACCPVGRVMLREAAASTARRRSFFISTEREGGEVYGVRIRGERRRRERKKYKQVSDKMEIGSN